jgi:phage shock protein E
MSKQSFKTISLIIIIVAMFGIFKNIFGQPDNQALKEAINNGAFLVDVRTPAEFAQGSVPGAVNIPLDQISQQISKFNNKKSIVVFCRSGSRSGQAKSILERNGHNQVINGGTWQNVNETKNQ